MPLARAQIRQPAGPLTVLADYLAAPGPVPAEGVAMVSQLNGAGPLVATQAERAACFRRYVATALQRETLVGYHWFEHADQPAAGRFDGEKSNFGAVTIDDSVYKELIHTMKLLNAEAECRHAAAAHPIA